MNRMGFSQDRTQGKGKKQAKEMKTLAAPTAHMYSAACTQEGGCFLDWEGHAYSSPKGRWASANLQNPDFRKPLLETAFGNLICNQLSAHYLVPNWTSGFSVIYWESCSALTPSEWCLGAKILSEASVLIRLRPWNLVTVFLHWVLSGWPQEDEIGKYRREDWQRRETEMVLGMSQVLSCLKLLA